MFERARYGFKETAEEARKMWIDRLRHGGLTQATGRLHRNKNDKDSYCCLGVACELFRENYPDKLKRVRHEDAEISPGRENDHDKYINLDTGAIDVSILPLNVCRWLNIYSSGLIKNEAVNTECKGYSSLVSLNDNAEYTFAQIADVIEKDYLVLVPESQEKPFNVEVLNGL